MSFYISNYHSLKAIKTALSSGVKIKLLPLPLSKEQLKANRAAESAGYEPPHSLPEPLPFHQYEDCQGSFNKQVPFFTFTAITEGQCYLSKAE